MQLRSAALSASFCVCIGMFIAFSASAQLIEPTRTLASDTTTKSTLTVLSEPPGLPVMLDGKMLGATPVFNARLDAGTHLLQVDDNQTPLDLAANTSVRIALFKGAYIEMPDPPEPVLSPKSRADETSSPIESPTQPLKKAIKTNDPFYWPLNPRGPIN